MGAGSKKGESRHLAASARWISPLHGRQLPGSLGPPHTDSNNGSLALSTLPFRSKEAEQFQAFPFESTEALGAGRTRGTQFMFLGGPGYRNVLGQYFSKRVLWGSPGEGIKCRHLSTSPESTSPGSSDSESLGQGRGVCI